MSKENLERFCRLVLENRNLRNQLKLSRERHEFIGKVVELATENGVEVTRKDVERQLIENRRLWNERWI